MIVTDKRMNVGIILNRTHNYAKGEDDVIEKSGIFRR